MGVRTIRRRRPGEERESNPVSSLAEVVACSVLLREQPVLLPWATVSSKQQNMRILRVAAHLWTSRHQPCNQPGTASPSELPS